MKSCTIFAVLSSFQAAVLYLYDLIINPIKCLCFVPLFGKTEGLCEDFVM